MSNASPVKFGNANSGSTRDDALFLKVFAGEVTRLAYMTDEAKEGRDAFLEKRKPAWKNC